MLKSIHGQRAQYPWQMAMLSIIYSLHVRKDRQYKDRLDAGIKVGLIQ